MLCIEGWKEEWRSERIRKEILSKSEHLGVEWGCKVIRTEEHTRYDADCDTQASRCRTPDRPHQCDITQQKLSHPQHTKPPFLQHLPIPLHTLNRTTHANHRNIHPIHTHIRRPRRPIAIIPKRRCTRLRRAVAVEECFAGGFPV